MTAELELRDPRAATKRLNYVGVTDAPMVPEWDADAAMRWGWLANVIAYRCVQLRAQSASSVPFVVGRKMGDAGTIRDNAPMAKLLGPPPNHPAKKLSSRKLFRWTHAQKIVTGRGAWEIEAGTNGRPVAFWPLVSAQLRATPSKSGNEWFRLFEYGPHHQAVEFKPDEVFYIWEPSLTDFRQPTTGLQASRYNLTLLNMSDRYGISFLRNNAVPASVVTTAQFPNEKLRDAFRRQWGAEFGGVDNAGRTMFNEVDDGDGPVSESIDVKVLGISAKDSRMIEQRKAAMVELAISLGVPWSKLDASGRTFDNAEIEDRTYWEETILPDLEDLQDEINMQVAPRLGDEVGWFDLRNVRALKRKRFAIGGSDLPALLDRGVVLTNEVREDLELEPVEWGDEPLELAPPEQLALPPASTDADEETDDEEDERAPVTHETRVVDPEQVELRRANLWRNADAVATTIEARWTRAWRRLFARQLATTLDRLLGKRGRQLFAEARDAAPEIDPSAIFDQSFWTAIAADTATDLYDETVAAALAALATRFGVGFDMSAPWVAQFIESRAQQLAGQVTQTTYDAIRTEMVEGIGLGESIDDIATRIRTVFAQADETRAVTIARTEVISAYNGAATLGAATLPADVVAAQEWIATRDGRTRDAHASADGQIVAVGQPFTVGGHSMAYPGDPNGGASNTVNCRCAVAFLTPEEYAELSERSPRRIEMRAAHALLALAQSVEHFDFITWRRAAEEVAA